MPTLLNKNILTNFTERKKCPNTEFFPFSIFLYSDQTKLHIWTLLRTKKLRIWTFFTQCQYIDKLLDSIGFILSTMLFYKPVFDKETIWISCLDLIFLTI